MSSACECCQRTEEAEAQLVELQVIELELQRELGHANAAAKASANVTSTVHPGGEPG